ncbi:MAG: lysophospholipid acyltransferase family protein [Phycisphaerales bacterium]
MDATPTDENLVLPARPSGLVAGMFMRYLRRTMRSSFHAVRWTRGGEGALQAALSADEPVIVVMNHSSWWDPLIGLWVNDALTGPSARPMRAPMAMEQLRRFTFFRRLGVFGIEARAPGALEEMVTYLRREWHGDDPPGGRVPALWITPQGEFADVRSPVRVRPGVGAVATRAGVERVCALACELVHWTDRRPELLLRSASVPAPERASTSAWTRAITRVMNDNAEALAIEAKTRDAGRFEVALGGATRVHPLFDLWLKVTGRAGAIDGAAAESSGGRG